MKISRLKEYEEITIIEIRKYHPVAKVRERALALELLNKGITREEISKTLGRLKKTISNWTVSYKKYGIAGLFDEERSGRPREITDEIRERIIEIAESPETSTKSSIRTNTNSQSIEY